MSAMFIEDYLREMNAADCDKTEPHDGHWHGPVIQTMWCGGRS